MIIDMQTLTCRFTPIQLGDMNRKFRKKKLKIVRRILRNLSKRKDELEWLQSIDGRIHMKEIGEYTDQRIVNLQNEYSTLLRNIAYWQKVYENITHTRSI